MRGVGSVVVGAENLVPRHFQVTVIALEIAVVHLMVKCAERKAIFVLHQQSFESGMRGRGGQRLMLHMKQDMDWMRRNDPVNQNRAKEKQMLDRVHRQAGPRTDIDVPVVDGMGQFVERRPMQPAVNPIKVKRYPHRRQKDQRDKPDRIFSPCQHGCIAICHGPEHQHFKRRPERHAAGQRPEHIIRNLRVESEHAAFLRKRARVEFQLIALPLLAVEPQMQTPGNRDHQHQIATPDLGDPSVRKSFCIL